MKRPRAAILISCMMLVILLFADSAYTAETVYPKDLTKFENFDERGLEITQKDFVSKGHQPWRFDPVYYARFFMNFLYPKLDPNERDLLSAEYVLEGKNIALKLSRTAKWFGSEPTEWDILPDGIKLKYDRAVVKIVYDKKQHAIYLHKAFPSNSESIWIIDEMRVER